MTATAGNEALTGVRKAVRRLYRPLLIISCVVNLLLLVSAIYMLQIYNRVLSSGSKDTLVWLTVVALGAILVYGVLEHTRRQLLGRASYWIETELGAPVLRKAMADRLAGTNPRAGLGDVAALRSFLGGDAVLAFLDAPWTPVFLALIWLLHPSLGILAVCSAVALFAFALLNDLLTRGPQKQLAAELRKNEISAQTYVESGETIGPLGMGEALLGNWRSHQQMTRQEYQRLKEKTSRIFSASRALRIAMQVMILGLGAYLVLAGELTPGAMIAASIILGRALAPIERSISAWQGFVSSRTALARLRAMFADAAPETRAVRLPRPAGNLDVEDLYCIAPGSDETILENISFKLGAGETLAIIGPSGSGKSTLCRLLVGAWAPARGHVRLDSADVSTWDPEDLGRHIGYLPQKVDLFPGSVADNIARMKDVDDADIVKAARVAGVHDLILRLPNGYETDVGLHGGRISGGQRQRLGLARALFGDPAFIVLDEPSSNLDQDGDLALASALERLKALKRTVVIVSHRPMWLRAADKVLVLKDGAVASYGPRDEVLKVRHDTRAQPAEPKQAPQTVARSVTAKVVGKKTAAE